MNAPFVNAMLFVIYTTYVSKMGAEMAACDVH